MEEVGGFRRIEEELTEAAYIYISVISVVAMFYYC